METDLPAGALAAAIGHGIEVDGMKHHIPHTIVMCDKPALKSRRFTTVCELRW